MDADKQKIIDLISAEISKALISLERSRGESSVNIDETDAHISSYSTRVNLLRGIRTQLEDEFTVMHYDPR